MASTTQVHARRGSAWQHLAVGMTAFITGWTVCVLAGTEVWGAAGAVALALAASGALALRFAHPRAGLARTGGEAAMGAAIVLVLAPLWGIRPLFANADGVARGVPLSTSAEAVWLLGTIVVSLAVLGLMVPLAIALGRAAAGGAMQAAPSLWLPRRRWPAAGLLGAGLLLSAIFTFLTLEAIWSDQIPGTTPSAEFLPAGALPVECPVESIAQYVNGDRTLGQAPGTRPFADSWHRMQRHGLVEGSVGLLVTKPAQCDRVVDTDPWIETFVFRFDSSANALAAYQAGLFGIVPVADPRRQATVNEELGSSSNLNAAWTNYGKSGSQTQLTTFWPYENYLVFFVCRNVDSYRCEHLTHPMAPNYYEGGSIQDKIEAAMTGRRWFHSA